MSQHEGNQDQENQLIHNLIEQQQPIVIENQGDYLFHGNGAEFIRTVTTLSAEELRNITKANIILIGEKVKDQNQLCICLTCFFGCLIWIPFTFMSCKWWQKIALEKYDLKIDAYESLKKLADAPNIKNLRLQVKDNCLDQSKGSVLYRVLKESNLSNFMLTNTANGLDYSEENYFSCFEENFKSVLTLQRPNVFLQWETKHLQ